MDPSHFLSIATYFACFLETGFHCVVQTGFESLAQAGLELMVILMSPEYWDYRCKLPCLLVNINFKHNVSSKSVDITTMVMKKPYRASILFFFVLLF